MQKRTPRNGTSYQTAGADPFVAYGDQAYEYENFCSVNDIPKPMIMPGGDPARYEWPVVGKVVTIQRHGYADTTFVCLLVTELYRQGARSVYEGQELQNPLTDEVEDVLREQSGFQKINKIERQEHWQFIKGSGGFDEEFSYLIKGIIPANSFGMLFGKSGSFKSFQAISWACHIATGKHWDGHKVKQAPVLLIAGEGGQGVPRRIKAWELTHNDGQLLEDLYRLPFAVTFNDFDQVSHLAKSIHHYEETIGKKFGLIILDTLARCFGAADENQTKDMNAFINACDQLKQETGATVLVVHHTGHSDQERARGSSALNAALDFEFRAQRDPVIDTMITLSGTKSKEEHALEPRAYSLQPVFLYQDSDGDKVESLVMASTGQEANEPESEPEFETNNKARKMTNGQMIVIDAIHEMEGQNEPPTYEAVRELAKEKGLRRDNYARTVKTLKNQGRIEEIGGVLRASL